MMRRPPIADFGGVRNILITRLSLLARRPSVIAAFSTSILNRYLLRGIFVSVSRYVPVPVLAFITLLFSSATMAEVDNVIHPNVEAGRKQIDYRVTGYNGGDDNPDFQRQRLGFGYGVNNRVAVEGYLVGEKNGGDALNLQAYALEARWQLNAPGAAWLDSAMLFRLVHADDGGYSKAGTGFLAEKALDAHWIATANVVANYVFGDDVAEKLEGEMAAQVRYRVNRQFEPGVEAYWDEDLIAVGPAATGIIAVDGQHRLTWEVAALLTVDHDIADKVFRGSLNWSF